MKIFNKILLSIGIIFIIAVLILFILGRIEREGYLSDISINTDATLKLNNINIEDAKKLFFSDAQLDYSSLTNYIFTNSNILKYSYNFRISYYSKVFRNSDIYGVYLNTNNLADHITSVEFEDKGSPFGLLISTKKLQHDENINNVYYRLKLKISIVLLFLVSILFIYLLVTFIFIIINKEKRKLLLEYFKRIKFFCTKNKKYIFVSYSIIIIIFILFVIINSNIKLGISKITDFELITESKLGYVYKCNIEDYKNSKLFSINEIMEIDNTNDIKYYGYSLEITNKPIGSWYSTNIYYTENNTFIISNESTNQNAYSYNIQVPTYKGDKYKITILAKKLSEKGNIFWHLNGYNNFKEIINKEISNDYIVLTDSREIYSKAGGVLELHFIMPQGVTEIESILIESLNDNLNTEYGDIVFTSLNRHIDNIEVKYNIKPNINNFFTYLILMILPLIIKYIFWIIFDFIKLILTQFKKIKLINLKNRYVYILFVFLCFLIMPNIIYNLFGDYFDKTNYEKRPKEGRPILSLNNLSEYPTKYEKHFNDYIPFRNELIQLKNIIDLFIFKNIFSDRVILGIDNWLFFKNFPLVNDFIGIYEFTDEELEKSKNNLINFRDELKKKNIDFILMICPNKNLIYEEKMPNYIKRNTKINSTDKFIEYMNKNTDVKIVYPKIQLLEHKYKYQLYYKYDTHWNYIGAYIGYSELMKKIDINTTSLDNLIVSNSGKVSGDLAGMINFVTLYSDDNDYILNSFTSNDYIILDGVKHYYNAGYCKSDSTNTNNILMIRDSFTSAMFDYIAASFYKSSFIHISQFKNSDIIDNKPNIVVFQTVERDLKNYLLNILPSYNIENINKNSLHNSLITNN